MLELLLFGAKKRFLDGRADVAAAYSLRRVNSLYRGPVVRVRRSSDSVEADFGAGQSGADWGTIAGFIGAGSGFVSKWYDQSGNGRDLVQATASAQPQISLVGNGLPAAVFDGVNDQLLVAFTLNQPWSFNLIRRTISTSGQGYTLDGGSAAQCVLYNDPALADNLMFAGSTGPTSDLGTNMPTGTRGAIGGVFNNASSRMEINSATVASYTGTTGTNNNTGLTVGGNNSRFGNQEIQEVIAFNTAHTQAQLQADNAAMRSAWRF